MLYSYSNDIIIRIQKRANCTIQLYFLQRHLDEVMMSCSRTTTPAHKNGRGLKFNILRDDPATRDVLDGLSIFEK